MARRWSFFMSPLEHRTLRVLDDWHRAFLTPVGRALVWASVVAGFQLLGGLYWPLLLLFGFCFGAPVLAFVLGFFFRPRLSARRRLPPPPSAGDELRYQVVVRNEGRRAARNVTVEERGLPVDVRPVEEAPVIDEILPGAEAVVTLRLSCKTRGVYTLPALQTATLFPSGLVKVPRKHKVKDRLLVYPRFTPLQDFDVPHGRNYQPGGIPVASQIGESSEFFGTREWRDGDRLRDVHWPSFARTGKLVVKEFQEEYFARLALVLDVCARGRKEELLLEKALSMAAGIADALARREYIIDLFAAGPKVFHFQAGRALAHFENILEILACLEPGDRLDLQALEAALMPAVAQLSAVILVVMDWDEPRAQIVHALRSRGVAVRVLCVHPRRRPEGLAPDEVIQVS